MISDFFGLNILVEDKMLKRICIILLTICFVSVSGVAFIPTSGKAQDVPRISVEELNRSLENDKLLIIDARSGSDWIGSSLKIKGAIRGKAGKEKIWAKALPKDSEIVIYCA